MRRTVVGVLLSAWCCVGAGAQTAPLVKRIDAAVEGERQHEHVPGVAVAVVRHGRVVLAKGYGEANVEHHVPVTRQTVFQSGSVGKQFTSVAVMLAVEAGQLDLDAPLTHYLPEAPASWQAITPRHLLTHTSGLATYSDRDLNYRADYTEDELLKVMYRLPLEFPPGERWSYSNSGYLVLGILLHQVTGQFYGDILQARVFRPLGMPSARIISESDIVAHRAAGYQRAHGQLQNQDWVAPSLNTTADGALYLSLEDYLAWDAGLRRRAILTPASWTQIYTPVTLKSGRTYPYGFGWNVERMGQGFWYHHGGSWQGFRVQVSRYGPDELTVIVLANLAEASPARFVDAIVAVVDPLLPRLEPQSPLPEQDPALAQRVHQLLADLAAGRLSQANLPKMRRDFFPEELAADRELVEPLGEPQRLDLVSRRELGDDVEYGYRVHYAQRTLRLSVNLTPQAEVAELYLESD
ncbi:MAG: beta-lactamase family protein [Gammaproteobacteria bacterium]|nr:beta-lactamase family protein [Gammaproteobacteria bacterium]